MKNLGLPIFESVLFSLASFWNLRKGVNSGIGLFLDGNRIENNNKKTFDLGFCTEFLQESFFLRKKLLGINFARLRRI